MVEVFKFQLWRIKNLAKSQPPPTFSSYKGVCIYTARVILGVEIKIYKALPAFCQAKWFLLPLLTERLCLLVPERLEDLA